MKLKQILKNIQLSSDYLLKLEDMKAELLVIVNHHVTVKRTLVLYTPPVTAREFVCLKWDEFNMAQLY